MRKFIYAIAAVAAFAWSPAAWAVLQETTVTLTDNGKPLPEATITLNRITDSEPPPEPKTEKTDEGGKIVIVHEKEDNTSESAVEIIVHTAEGKTLMRRVVLKELLISETIDVAAPSETQQVSERSHDQCSDLTNLDDPQLEILIKDPDMRARIVKLIEETEDTDEAEPAKETDKVHESGQETEKKTVTKKGKETKKLVHRKPGKKKETAQGQGKTSPNARDLLGTGLSIGLGIAGSHGRRDHGTHSGHPKGMD